MTLLPYTTIFTLTLYLLLNGCSSGSDSSPPMTSTPDPEPVRLACPAGGAAPQSNVTLPNNLPAGDISIVVDAGATAGLTLSPVWRDHYDLSYTHLRYANESGFTDVVDRLNPRSWRTSVGRWEIGMPAPDGATSDDPETLKKVNREFYRGENTLAAADDINNYDFTYLDKQLDDLINQGAEPFLSFDYMPFVLAQTQDTNNDFNEYKQRGEDYSFSNGIRTSPPADPAVYARVVRNTMRHVLGQFPAGGRDYGVDYFEIGNEPEFSFFWAGDRQQYITMYNAIVDEVSSDTDLASVKIGAASFALPTTEIVNEQDNGQNTFLRDFAEAVTASGKRMDFVSYHSYSNDYAIHAISMAYVNTLMTTLAPDAEIVNGEWGLDLNNSLDTVYDSIEHGLFRAKVLMLMQLYNVHVAHESLLRDPLTSDCTTGQLGTIETGPAKGKAVYDVYRAMNLMSDTLIALPITNTEGTFVMAGKDENNSKVVVLFIAEQPAAAKNVTLTVNNLPWTGGSYTRYEVSQATHDNGQGVKEVETGMLSGSSFNTDLSYEQAQLMVWELNKP